MAYKISNTNGTTLLILADNTVDESVTSLSLVGKNLNAYGQYINNNFIKLLANSANPTSNQPRSPLVGQLWYDTTAKRLKVYDGKFKPVTGAIVSTTVPTDPSTGDLWWDSGNFQLSAWNGSVWTIVGPPFKKSIGDNGWILPSDQHPVQNLDGVTQKVTLLKNYGETIGLITTASFTTNLDFPVNYLSPDFAGLTFSITKGLTMFGDIYSKGRIKADSLSASSLSIYGDIFTSGKIIAQELDIQYTTVTTISIKTDDVYTSSNTSSSTSTTTGAIVVAGGIGVGKGIYVGGIVTATSVVSTSMYVTTLTATNLIATTGVIASLTSTNITATSITVSSLTATNTSTFNKDILVIKPPGRFAGSTVTRITGDSIYFERAWNTSNSLFNSINPIFGPIPGQIDGPGYVTGIQIAAYSFNVTSTATFDVDVFVGGTVYANDNLIVGSTTGEGGQLVLGWAGINNIAGQSNSTWNVDVDSSNNLRIFSQNASGSTTNILTASTSTSSIVTLNNITFTNQGVYNNRASGRQFFQASTDNLAHGIGIGNFGYGTVDSTIYSTGGIRFITSATINANGWENYGVQYVSISSEGIIYAASGIASTTTDTGSLVVVGGLGVSGNTFMGKVLSLTVSTAAPTNPSVGMFAVADRVTWDPASKGSGNAYPVFYNGSTWNALY